MRVLEDVADDASVLSIVGDVVFVVISRHNQLNFLVIFGRKDDVAFARSIEADAR